MTWCHCSILPTEASLNLVLPHAAEPQILAIHIKQLDTAIANVTNKQMTIPICRESTCVDLILHPPNPALHSPGLRTRFGAVGENSSTVIMTCDE